MVKGLEDNIKSLEHRVKELEDFKLRQETRQSFTRYMFGQLRNVIFIFTLMIGFLEYFFIKKGSPH